MKLKHWALIILLSTTFCAFINPKRLLSTYISNYDNVLGTSLELKFRATNENEADLAEQNVLKEIDRLDNILSAYKPNSEFNRWLSRGNESTKISTELFEVLKEFDQYKTLTNGALDPSVALIGNIWQEAAISNTEPSVLLLKKNVALLNQKHYILDEHNQTVTRLDKVPLVLNSFAKSYVINKAAEKAIENTAINQVVVNIGGDLVVKGRSEELINISNPKADFENANGISRIKVFNKAVATSGNYRRGFSINGKWYSHIVDPRTGYPVTDIISATVIADNASDAGALATSFNILSIAEIEKLAKTKNIAYLLVTKDGNEIKSKNWASFEIESEDLNLKKTNSADKLWDPKFELVVNFEIAKVETAMRYRRPYVAVWIEDSNKSAVRNLALWYNKPRWLADLKQWNRTNNEEFKKGEEGKLVSITSATRGAGKYSLVWDGKDDSGNLVKAGTYTVLIEIAREHGSHQIISKEMKFNGKANKLELTSNEEIASASLEYRKINK